MPPEELLALLPYMPPLFSKDLPPCGLHPQVAYEDVVHRLRKAWLLCAKQNPANIPLLAICKSVLDEYKTEAIDSPPGTEAGTKERKPWRRERIFQWEISWAKYFVREVETLASRASMTEEEKEQEDYILDLCPVPQELYIYVKNKANRNELLEMWRAWQKKKRTPGPAFVAHGRSESEQGGKEGGEDGPRDDKGSGDVENQT
ncbi:hypothetical protein ACJBU6_01762 [Exserohilum turcicum]